jgi:threonine-phosphate decarboxylase
MKAHILNTENNRWDFMTRAGACSHGGIYSVDYKRVKLDFSSNVNPLGAPRRAVKSIENQASRLAPVYPDPECRDLKKSLSRYLDVDAKQITVGNGAAEIIYWFAQVFTKSSAIIPVPTFCEYELAVEKVGAKITFVPLAGDFTLDADNIIKSAKGADTIFMCNPNNPTGLLATDAVRKVIEEVDPSTKILLDECFIELVDRPKTNTLIHMVHDHKNLVVLRSLTKSFGMAGLRLGYSVSNPFLAQAMQERKTPWNVNGLAQVAGIAALSDTNHVAKARALVKRERRFLFNRIQKAGYLPLRSDANYFLVQLPKSDSHEFRDRLLKETGVLVRDCSTFTEMGTKHIRVAIKTHKENLKLARALERLAKVEPHG